MVVVRGMAGLLQVAKGRGYVSDNGLLQGCDEVFYMGMYSALTARNLTARFLQASMAEGPCKPQLILQSALGQKMLGRIPGETMKQGVVGRRDSSTQQDRPWSACPRAVIGEVSGGFDQLGWIDWDGLCHAGF